PSRDVPHAGSDRTAGPGDACHLANPSVRIAHEPDDEGGDCYVELGISPRQLFGYTLSDVGPGMAIAAGRHELGRGVDRGDVFCTGPPAQLAGEAARPAAHIQNPQPGRDSGDVGEGRSQREGVTTHEAVVVWGRCGELSSCGHGR